MITTKNRLITIPMSHYCEKARWALDQAGLPYVEIKHLQGFHYLYSFRAAHSPTVPVLVTESGTYKDSTDILKWVDKQLPDTARLYPERADLRKQVEEYEEYLDETFGPAGRLWMYSYMLNHVDILFKYSKAHGIPTFEIKAMSALFPLFKPFANHRLKMTSESSQQTEEIVDAVFDKVAAQLNDRQYLFGDQFTAADLTFAALSAPALLPEKYGVALPGLDELPSEMADQIRLWRNHPAGKFALRLYEMKRLVNKSRKT